MTVHGLVFLFLVVFGVSSSAAEPQVETLFLKRKRIEAIELLVQQRIQLIGPRREYADQEYLEKLKHLIEAHFTNRALKIYERAVSLRKTLPRQAIDKINEVEKLEPENLKIKRLKTLLLLSIEDCRGAQVVIEAVDEIYPQFADLNWLKSLLFACRKAEMTVEFQPNWSNPILLAHGAHAARLQKKSAIKMLLPSIQARWPEYAEIWFYKMILTEDTLEREKYRDNYRAACLESAQQNSFPNNPWFCKNVDTVLPSTDTPQSK